MKEVGSTVFVVDDNPGVRKGLTALLESSNLAVEAFATADEFLASFDPDRPGCLLLDIRLRGTNGLDLQDELRRRKAILPVIVLTGHGNVPTSVRALKAGAVDFLQKSGSPEILVESVRAALDGDRRKRAEAAERNAVLGYLAKHTPREREVMKLLITGMTSKEIAATMNISVRTIEGHRRRVLEKLNVTSAAQLVRVVLHVLPGASDKQTLAFGS